jgi:NRPS condensation-like uncharacterized protein
MRAGKIKAESFDIMQYFYGSVHEPLIHALIRFSGSIDEAALKKAVTLSMDAVPPLRCCFNTTGRRPFWEDRGFTGEHIVRCVAAEISDDLSQAKKLLAETIDPEREPQLKIHILRSKTFDTLCIIMSHLVCDGSGFKEYLYLLSRLYLACANGETTPKLYAAPRGTGQLFKSFNLPQKLRIALQKYNASILKQQTVYRLQGDAGNPFFVTRKIQNGEAAKIKEAGRRYGSTLNDMMLAAYIRVLSRRTGEKRIVMPCPVDLRKYIPGGRSAICNLTTNYICDITVGENDSFDQTAAQVAEQMKWQKESTACLKSVILLETAFKLIPFRSMRKKFNKLFTIPVISYTNLGIVDKDKLFGGLVTDMFLTGAVKYVPYFQLAVLTFDGAMTLSCNLYGTCKDKEAIEEFLKDVHHEMLSASLGT